MNRSLRSAAIIAAATIGSGEFALPYVVHRTGWALILFSFAVLGVPVVVAHAVYLRTLERVRERERLLGLAKRYFGPAGFWIGFLAIVIGLFLSFVIFLILGTRFLQIIFPALPYAPALFLFWALIATAALIGNRRAIGWERVSVLLVVVVIA